MKGERKEGRKGTREERREQGREWQREGKKIWTRQDQARQWKLVCFFTGKTQTIKWDREIGTVLSKALMFQVMISNPSMTDQTITWKQLNIGVTNTYFISAIFKPRSFLRLHAKSPRVARMPAFMSSAKLQDHREEK